MLASRPEGGFSGVLRLAIALSFRCIVSLRWQPHLADSAAAASFISRSVLNETHMRISIVAGFDDGARAIYVHRVRPFARRLGKKNVTSH